MISIIHKKVTKGGAFTIISGLPCEKLLVCLLLFARYLKMYYLCKDFERI